MRELNGLSCSINYDRAKVKKGEGKGLKKYGRKAWGRLLVLMKVLSSNVCGLGGASRRLVVKEMVTSQKVQIVMLQESKLKEVFDRLVKELWGRGYVNWVVVDAVGAAGGQLLLWDTCLVSGVKSWKDIFSISVFVEDLTTNTKWLLTSVYGPNSS